MFAPLHLIHLIVISIYKVCNEDNSIMNSQKHIQILDTSIQLQYIDIYQISWYTMKTQHNRCVSKRQSLNFKSIVSVLGKISNRQVQEITRMKEYSSLFHLKKENLIT
jgi:hypothetical protein